MKLAVNVGSELHDCGVEVGLYSFRQGVKPLHELAAFIVAFEERSNLQCGTAPSLEAPYDASANA